VHTVHTALSTYSDEEAVLVKLEEGTVESAKSKKAEEHLRIQAEQEGRQINNKRPVMGLVR